MNNGFADFMAGLVIGLVLCLICSLAFYHRGIEETKDRAVKVGAAEYYLDASYNRQFRWRP